jgi:hypothetical protein
MSRKPSEKPWLHAKSGFWCTTLNGRREYLDKDYRVACKKLTALRKTKQTCEQHGRDWLDAGRLLQTATVMSGGDNREMIMAGMLLKDLKVSLVTDETPTQLGFTVQASGLPDVPAIIKTVSRPTPSVGPRVLQRASVGK